MNPRSIGPMRTSPTIIGWRLSPRALPAPGQGQGRSGGASGGTVDSRHAAPPDLLHTPRSQSGHCRALARSQRPPVQETAGVQASLFDSLDRPALRPLPAHPYVYAEWKNARVNIDYHVEVEGHYYSVPYTLVKQQLDVRVTTPGGRTLPPRTHASPAIAAPPSKAAIARSRRTCPPPTNTMPSGPPSG